MLNITDFDLQETPHSFDYEVRADFDGHFKDGFYVKCFVDVTTNNEATQQTNEEIEIQGEISDVVVDSVDFWLFEVYNSANEIVSFAGCLLDEIKYDVEDKITKQIQKD